MEIAESKPAKIVHNYIKVLKHTFDCFYGKENVSISNMEETTTKNPILKDEYVITLSDKTIPLKKEVKISRIKSSKWFESFLFESIQKYIYYNNMSNLSDKEAEKYGRIIYSKACKLFEEYLNQFFHVSIKKITEISATFYESAEADGNICFFLQPTVPSLCYAVQDTTKFSFDNMNVRKLLEVTSMKEPGSPLALAFSYQNKWLFSGFITMDSEMLKYMHFIRFSFLKHMVWDMYLDSEQIVRYCCGNYINPESEENELIFKSKINELIPDYNNCKMWGLVNAAILQKHGTILMILCEEEEIVKKEVEKILHCSSGTALNPTILEAEHVRRLTSLDGALVIDQDGMVYGYGMILAADGNNKIQRDPGRGARFNSAKLYIANLLEQGYKAMAVIVSEDGMVNFYSTKDAKGEIEANEKREEKAR